jgi:hypothetical protein
MTKTVRIENADTSTYPVRVTGQYKDVDGNWVDETSSTQLDHPTAMTSAGIHSGRRLVIEERAADPVPTAQP